MSSVFMGCMGIPPELYFVVSVSPCTLTCFFSFVWMDRCANHKLLISFKIGRC